MDGILNGKAYGSVAQRLLANGLSVNGLRTNATLLKDEWKAYDATVVESAKSRLVGVADLMSRGLVFNLGANGLGTTILETQTQSDVEEAQVSMAGVTEGKNDRQDYGIEYLPLPITHYDFFINIRSLMASRKMGYPQDTTRAAIAARKVAEKLEQYLFQGSGGFTFGGGTIYGYMNHPSRNTATLTTQWTNVAKTGEDILNDVIGMKSKINADLHFGPFVLYVPTAYEAVLDKDFKANSDLTVRQRLLQLASVQKVKVADSLTNHNVILAQMTADTVRMVEGLPVTTVEWEEKGGMVTNFKVMTINVPQLRADYNGNMGICHLA